MSETEGKYSGEDQVKKFVEDQEKATDDFKNKVEGNKEEVVGAPIQETGLKPPAWQKREDNMSAANEVGWHQIPIKELPTQGLFYPENTEIVIRAATGAEIRHWSTMEETDLAVLDDMLNYVLERCVRVKGKNVHASWKDIKEVDRFYLILAVSELTFVKGENKLQVKVSENKKIDVVKDMIDYVSFDPRIMKYYDEDERLFNLILKDGTSIKTTLPSVGVTNWIKKYVIRKNQMGESIDEDFVSFAPFVILDWRGLNDATYIAAIEDSLNWTLSQVSGVTTFKNIFMETVNPVVKYTDEEGGERRVPLNFQGGIKSIFLISDPFGELA